MYAMSRKWRRDLLIGFFSIIAFFAFIPVFTYYIFASDLTTETRLMSHNDRGVTLLDRNGQPFFEFYQAKAYNSNVTLSQIPKYTQQAVISSEDKDFYRHHGFSVSAIARSFVEDVTHRSLSYGASTITQQLVKNSLLTSNKNLLRKYQEVVLASEIERRYTKDQILQMYLSSVYFGEGSFGIEEASHTYFNKPASDLNLAESAMLAGLLPAPSKLSPINGDLEGAKKRQLLILDKMVKQGYIERKQEDEALKTKLVFNTSSGEVNAFAPHFALMVKDNLIQTYGEEKLALSGFKVKTTLDLGWQKYAESVVADQVKKLAPNNVSNGSAVVLDAKTGEIRVMVGSKDWYNNNFGKFNVALSGRPPGSSFKPIVYVAAFEKGLITPATILHDNPTAFVNDPILAKYNPKDPNAYYKPVDFDRKFWGPMPPRRALSNSRNVPAVEVLSKLGVPEALDMAKRLGITTLAGPDQYGLSLVLGAGDVRPLELTNVYATFANNGYKNNPVSIAQIDDRQGNVIYKYVPDPVKVLDEGNVFEITSILSDNSARAEEFGNTLTISRPAAVKTGTTEDFKDAWTLGYTPGLAIGVWVGNNDNVPMDSIAGSLGAAPIWKALMEKFTEGTPVEKFEPPQELIPMIVCANGGVAKATPGAKVEYFVPGTQPDKACSSNVATPSASLLPSASVAPTPISTPSSSPGKVVSL